MDASTYAVEAAVEATHWWFVGRRRLFAREIEREIRSKHLTAAPRVLDIGTSTGTNLRMLREIGLGHVTGVDVSDEAIRFCMEKDLGPVRKGDVCALPFAAGSFDLVLATDVIEHVDDDALALREIARVLAPGGTALITVPAFPALWGLQDDVARHKRRYRRRPLLDKIAAAGLVPFRGYFFNYLLFAPIWTARQLIRRLGLRFESEAQINAPWLNAVLAAVFALDIRLAPVVRSPVGVSLLVLAEKR